MRWEYMWGDRSDRLHEDDLAWPRPARCVLPSTLLSNQGQIPVCLHQYLTVHWETKDRHGWVGGRDGHAFSMRPYFMLRRVVDAKTMHRSKTSPALLPQNISCIPALKHLLNSRNKTSPAAKQLLHPRLSSPQHNKTSIAPDGHIPAAASPPPHPHNGIKINLGTYCANKKAATMNQRQQCQNDGTMGDWGWWLMVQWRKVVRGYYGISIGLSVAGQMSSDLRISLWGHRTDGMDMGYIFWIWICWLCT